MKRLLALLLMASGSAVAQSVSQDSTCGLVVTTVPESSAVYVENVFAGKAPVRLSSQKPGTRNIKVIKVNFAIWEQNVELHPGETVTVEAKLKTKFGMVSIEVNSPDAEVLVDGSVVSSGSVADQLIAGGWHEIEVRRVGGRDAVSEHTYIMPGEKARWQARFDVASRRAFLWSLAVPGLGQVIDGSVPEGLLFMGGFVAACLFTVTQSEHYTDALNQYNGTLARYRLLTDESQTMIAGQELSAQYDRLKSPRNLRTVAFALAGGVYVSSLVEAFLNHSSITTLSKESASTVGRIHPDLAVTGSEARLTLRIDF